MRSQLWIALPCALALACQTSYALVDEPPVEPEPVQTPDDALDPSAMSGSEMSGVEPPPTQPPIAMDPVLEPLGSECDGVGAYDWAPPSAEETCYELVAHDQSSATDTSKFVVQVGESVSQLYYDAPWPEGSVATRIGTELDNAQVVTEWRAFGTDEAQAHGTVSKLVTGTTIGTNAKQFARWSINNCNTVMPDDVGLELPGPGRKLMVQYLHLNFTGVVQPDATKVLVCTVPASTRTHVASYTILGTENLNGPVGMSPGMESTFEGFCANQSDVAITIVQLAPHMHAIGTYARLELLHGDGARASIFDRAFDSEAESHYAIEPRVQVQPGERLRAACTYFNDYDYSVAFGMSRSQETCEHVVLSYPAGALDKVNNATLIGTTNTCWGDD